MNRSMLFTALSAGLAVVVTIVTTGTLLLYIWWVVAPGLAVTAVVIGIRQHRPVTPRPWRVLLSALVSLWIGWTLSAVIAAEVVGPTTAGSLAVVRDLIYLAAYPALGAGSLLMVRARTGGRDRENVIDALIIMVAVALVLGAWMFGSGQLSRGLDGPERAWVLASPLVLAAVLSASIRVVFAGGQRVPAAWLLFFAGAFTLIGNVWTVTLIRDGTPTEVLGIDILWILGFVAVGSAALHPSMTELTTPLPVKHALDGMPTDRLWLLGVALGAAPLANLWIAGGSADAVAMATGGLLIVLLAMWRVNRLLTERDVARKAAVATASHDAIIATVGRWALDDLSTEELLARTDQLLADGPPSIRCRIVPTGRVEPRTNVGTAQAKRFVVTAESQPLAEVVTSADGQGAPQLEQAFHEAIAAMLSAAVQRRAAESKLRHDSLHDALTGLPNRSLALDRLTQLLSNGDAKQVAVVFLDLNGFKNVNDTWGHATGDRVLREIADRLLGAVRATDTVARLAGDEFAVLVPTSDRATLEALIERLRQATTLAVEGAQGQRLSVEASIGVTAGSGGTISAEELLHRADLAMYAAKQAGSAVIWGACVSNEPHVRGKR